MVDPRLLAFGEGDIQIKDGTVARIVIPSIEAGTYTACPVTPDQFLRGEFTRCATGALVQGGRLELVVPGDR